MSVSGITSVKRHLFCDFTFQVLRRSILKGSSMQRWWFLGLCLVVGCAQRAPQVVVQAAAAPEKQVGGQRRIIDRAAVDLRVASLSTLQSQVAQAVQTHQGYLESSLVQPANQSGHWTVRVPSANYSTFIAECDKWGTVLRSQQSAEDVTEQSIDLAARMATKRLEEQRLQTLLTEQTGALADVLAVEKELSRVREEIEQAEERLRYLEQQTSYATIQISATELVQVGRVAQGPLGSQLLSVLGDSCAIMLMLLRAGLLIAVALLPWLALSAIPAWLIWRWIKSPHAEESVTVHLRDESSSAR